MLSNFSFRAVSFSIIATLEIRKELEPKCVPQLFLESLPKTRQNNILFGVLSIVTAPEILTRPSFLVLSKVAMLQ